MCQRLRDVFPDSNQARLLGLDQEDDRKVWDYAKAHDFAVVTQDADFVDLSLLHGSPPKVIWLRCGNQPTVVIEKLLRGSLTDIEAFAANLTAGWLEIY